MVIKICISNTVVEFYPLEKMFMEKLYRGGGVLTLGAPLLIRHQNVFLQTLIIQRNHKSPSAQHICITKISIKYWYKQNNINREWRPNKDHQTAVEKQPDPATNVTKASDIWIIPGYYEMVQHIRPLNQSVPQDIVALWRKEDKFKYSHKKSCVI